MAVISGAQIRIALGLGGAPGAVTQQRADQARPRHKFVQDGGVPVVMLNSRGDDPTAPLKARIAELERVLDNEQAAHGLTKRALQEAQQAHQAAQTRLAHSEIAHTEALSVEVGRREAAEVVLRPRPAAAPTPIEHPTAKPKRAARVLREPRVAKPREPKPVKWWLPTFKEGR